VGRPDWLDEPEPPVDVVQGLLDSVQVLEDSAQRLGHRRVFVPEVPRFALNIADLLLQLVDLLTEALALMLGFLNFAPQPIPVVKESRDYPAEQVLTFLDPTVNALLIFHSLHTFLAPLLSLRARDVVRARRRGGFLGVDNNDPAVAELVRHIPLPPTFALTRLALAWGKRPLLIRATSVREYARVRVTRKLPLQVLAQRSLLGRDDDKVPSGLTARLELAAGTPRTIRLPEVVARARRGRIAYHHGGVASNWRNVTVRSGSGST
jgi:hypothetical protein